MILIIHSILGGIIFFCVLYKLFSAYSKDPLKSIPGPRGLPLVGYLPFIGRRIHLTLCKLWFKYGDVYRLKIGSRWIVVLNGQDTLKRALVDKWIDFAGRPDFYTYKIVSKESLLGVNDYSERYSKSMIMHLRKI